MQIKKKIKITKTRTQRVRFKLKQAKKLRLSVYISNRNISAQLINDLEGRTLAFASSLSPEFLKKHGATEGSKSMCNVVIAKEIGKILAEKALAIGISDNIVYDRGGRRFHGKIKALAEGAREGGLQF
jgi:large subunit ribosomal protein L18